MYKKYIKRVLDFIVSLIALLVLSPLFIVVIIINAILLKGNPFFVQQRPGENEVIFSIIKFRTMNNLKDENGNLLPDNKRISAFGDFLRKTSIDELPEFINILIGNMSIVGPRPLLVKYLPLYSKEQHQRHAVKPGLTGLAQINGRNLLSWDEKFNYDIEYVNSVSLKKDLYIIWETIIKVITREGITSKTSVSMEEFKGNKINE